MGEQANQKKRELKVDAHHADGVWSGMVRDPDGNALPGAVIVKPESSTRTVTDINGSFSITANSSDALYASFAGYKSVKLNGK